MNSKTKKIVLLTAGTGIVVTSIVTPIVIINQQNNKKAEDKKDVENVIKLLEEKTEKIITLPGDSKGKIIAKNQDKIIAKIKTLIGASNLKDVKIEISMENDQDVSLSEQKIMIKISKGEYSKELKKDKSYFVKRTKSNDEIARETAQYQINKIIAKIKDKDITIYSNTQLSGAIEIENAIKNQLQIENPTLTNGDLSKIDTYVSSLPINVKIQARLTVTIDSESQTLNIYVRKTSLLLKNSNIKEGWGGTIFQDEFKNLWAIGYDTKPQVLKANQNGDGYVNTGWDNDNSNSATGLLKGSQILSGPNLQIFQDEFKNLWAIGYSSKLQVLKANEDGDGYVTTGWTNANWNSNKEGSTGDPLLKNSNIVTGLGGTIFQDQFKNLWTMGATQKLQVLKANEDGDGYVTTGWTSATNSGLTNGSNINDGYKGIIFQDQFKNLWAMGAYTSLQVLKVNDDNDGYDEITGWTSATNSGLTSGSNINDGREGTIFQDEFKNLWAMGKDQKLQVLKANEDGDDYDVTTGWDSNNSNSATELLKGSKITNGNRGAIFQDKFKNLWAMGTGTPLQVLKANSAGDGYVTTGWINVNWNSGNLTNGSNITNGQKGAIFQDEFDNLWAMGYEKPLQVLQVNPVIANPLGDDYVTIGWTNAINVAGFTKNSNIINGWGGVIFQDKFKNLWTIGAWTPLQVLEVNSAKNGYIGSWQN